MNASDAQPASPDSSITQIICPAPNGLYASVPFLKVIGDPEPYCFTRDQKVVIWRHENPSEPEEVAESFSEVLMFEIHELEQRKEQKVKGEPIT
jgi:hypothetical protein